MHILHLELQRNGRSQAVSCRCHSPVTGQIQLYCLAKVSVLRPTLGAICSDREGSSQKTEPSSLFKDTRLDVFLFEKGKMSLLALSVGNMNQQSLEDSHLK